MRSKILKLALIASGCVLAGGCSLSGLLPWAVGGVLLSTLFRGTTAA